MRLTFRENLDEGSRGTPPEEPTELLQKLLRTPIGCAYHWGKT
mgnify:CR=1 FL=1